MSRKIKVTVDKKTGVVNITDGKHLTVQRDTVDNVLNYFLNKYHLLKDVYISYSYIN